MQLEARILRLVSLMSPESYKLQMVAKAFRLLTAENYRHRVLARRSTCGRCCVTALFYNRNAKDGPFLDRVYDWNSSQVYVGLYRMNKIVMVKSRKILS